VRPSGRQCLTIWTRILNREKFSAKFSENPVAHVSILALFCVYTKSLMCNDAATGIPLFRVKSNEFQSSLSAVRTMCHPVRTPICLLFHPSRRRVIPSRHQIDKHHLSGRCAYFVRTPTSYREASVPACFFQTFQQHVRTPISSRTVH
jgi:hypothetical protein